MFIKTAGQGGRPPGKIDASLNEKLQSVEWGEYKIGDLFDILSSRKKFDANKVVIKSYGKYPYVVRVGTNNGQKGYINEDEKYLNDSNTISFGQDTATLYYQETPYFTGDKIKVFKPRSVRLCKKNAQFFLVVLRRAFVEFSWGSSKFNVETLKQQKIQLPTKDGQINYNFMESFIAELETRRIAELEAYLFVAGLKDYKLTKEEKKALDAFNSLEWSRYNLEKLFGKSTRGKRLKSADRIQGELPFITAGDTDEGVSAYIGNEVEVFGKNTTTIDMFGSAKYRSFSYGADDHVAVVHTESLPVHAAIFVTTAIHKAAHTGKFDYSRNFYAKDADELDILLPSKEGKPFYSIMATFISAIQKLVIKDVVLYADKKIKAAKMVSGEK